MPNINPIFLLSIIIFGMIHSLEPGHGKSLVTTYILGNKKSKVIDVLLIGLCAFITHTVVISLISIIGFKFLDFVSFENKEIYLKIFASLIIFLVGIWLIYDRIFNPIIYKNHEHSHDDHGHHDHEHNHEHLNCCIHEKLTKKIKATSIIGIGLISGIIPCSGGLAIVMASIATGQFKNILNSFIYISLFSFGLGLTLSIIGLSVIYGKSLLASITQKSLSNIEKTSTIISAILVYSLGLTLLTYNLSMSFGEKLEEQFFHLHKHEHCDHCVHDHKSKD